MPRLGLGPGRSGPVGIRPSEGSRVVRKPGVLLGGERLNPTAEINRDTPAMVACSGLRCQLGLGCIEALLRANVAIPVGHARLLPEPRLITLRQAPESIGSVAAQMEGTAIEPTKILVRNAAVGTGVVCDHR